MENATLRKHQIKRQSFLEALLLWVNSGDIIQESELSRRNHDTQDDLIQMMMRVA